MLPKPKKMGAGPSASHAVRSGGAEKLLWAGRKEVPTTSMWSPQSERGRREWEVRERRWAGGRGRGEERARM